jgi:hypothetical protein
MSAADLLVLVSLVLYAIFDLRLNFLDEVSRFLNCRKHPEQRVKKDVVLDYISTRALLISQDISADQ